MADSLTTKTTFANALKELLKTTPFSKITVSGICEQCGLKRTSFYYHFLDKYDLVNWVFDTEYFAFMEEALGNDHAQHPDTPSGVTSWEVVLLTAKYFYAHTDFYKAVMEFDGQNSFRDHFRELLTPLLHTLLRTMLQDTKEIEFHVNFYSDAILAALLRWIEDPKRVEPEELVRLLKSCTRLSAEYLEIDPDIETLFQDA